MVQIFDNENVDKLALRKCEKILMKFWPAQH